MGRDISTGGMNAAAKTLGAWRYRCGPAFAKKSGHTPDVPDSVSPFPYGSADWQKDEL